MELYPGKHLFVDDFFIESLLGARRVRNRPDKLTVDRPLDIPLDRPWEQGTVQFAGVVYNEVNRCFRLYYRAWHAGRRIPVCAGLRRRRGVASSQSGTGGVRRFEGEQHHQLPARRPGHPLGSSRTGRGLSMEAH